MSGLLPHGDRVLCQAAARCLTYPDDALVAELPLVSSALDSARHGAAVLRPFLDHAAAAPVGDLAAHYVDVFDFKNRHCLYLSWWTDGDTRRRGASLVRFKEVYRAHGLEPTGEDLPDFLPVVLEFTAATGSDALLREHRAGLELLRIALAENGTPYAHVVAAVCAVLPGPSPRDRAEARALARTGPAREEVGLAGYAERPYGHLDLLPIVGADGSGGH